MNSCPKWRFLHPTHYWESLSVESPQERAYRSAYRKVEALQIELARHVYSIQRRQDAERKLQEAMAVLDRTRTEVIKLRNLQRSSS